MSVKYVQDSPSERIMGLPGFWLRCDRCNNQWRSCGPDQEGCQKCGEKYMPEKSILDGIEVKDKAFPLSESTAKAEIKTMSVVSYCKRCNAPIYGLQFIKSNESPIIKRSCLCEEGFRKFEDTIHYK